MTRYNIEMTHGQDLRVIEADYFRIDDDWLIFLRRPATGGVVEYWRVRRTYVVSLETKA